MTDNATDGACVKCGGPLRGDLTKVRDPLYVGAPGHWPENVCWDCCCEAWAEALRDRLLAHIGKPGPHWAQAIEIVKLRAAGHTPAEVADIQDCSRSTVYRRIQEVKNFTDREDFLTQNGA